MPKITAENTVAAISTTTQILQLVPTFVLLLHKGVEAVQMESQRSGQTEAEVLEQMRTRNTDYLQRIDAFLQSLDNKTPVVPPPANQG